jgi:hypothetical protein
MKFLSYYIIDTFDVPFLGQNTIDELMLYQTKLPGFFDIYGVSVPEGGRQCCQHPVCGSAVKIGSLLLTNYQLVRKGKICYSS